MNFKEFWNGNDVIKIFLAGIGCPHGQTLTDATGEGVDDEEYCDLSDCLLTGLIRTPEDRDGCFSGYGKLEGEEVVDGVWAWNGEGRAWDCSGNDYYQIKLSIK